MMGLFDAIANIDWTDVEEYSPGIPAGTYPFMLSAITTEEKATGTYLILTYLITEGPQKGKSQKEYRRIPSNLATEQDQRDASGVKTRLLNLGVPKDRINTFTPEDLLGTEGVIILVAQKDNPAYNKVVRVTVLSKDNVVPTLPSTVSVGTIIDDDDPFRN